MKFLLRYVTVLLLAFGAGAGRAAEPVTVTVVALERSPELIEVPGSVAAVERALVAAKVMGTIEQMPVTLGQRVRVGDLLVRIAAADISARVAQTRSQLDAVRKDVARERALLAEGASAREAVRALEDRVRAAEAQVREAEAMLEFAELRAPFAGTVVQRLAKPGDLAVPGAPLLELQGEESFEIETMVPERAAARLAVGGRLTVHVPAAAVEFVGTISELSSGADARLRTVAIKLAVPRGTPVRSGQYARVQVESDLRDHLLVPSAAVTRLGQMERAWVVTSEGRASLRLVRTGTMQGDRIEILAGLSAGERVIVTPPASMREGQSVEVQP